MDEAKALEALRTLIEYIGDDPDDPRLIGTPERVLKAWREDWGTGYHEPLPDLSMFQENRRFNEMVLVTGISFWSTCEHHLAAFYGTVDIGYIPDSKGVLGLSKFARIVNHFSRRLQLQERITEQIAEFLNEKVSDKGCGVVVRAKHLCMCSRGVLQPNAVTITTALKGVFFDDARARAEFFAATRP